MEFPCATVAKFLAEAVADPTWVQSPLAANHGTVFAYLTNRDSQINSNMACVDDQTVKGRQTGCGHSCPQQNI